MFDDEPEPQTKPLRTLEELKCPECGKWLVNAVDWASCPDGHGKLQKALTIREERITKGEAFLVRRHASRGSLGFQLEGQAGYWRKVDQDSDQPKDAVKAYSVSVSGNVTVVWVVKMEEKKEAA